MTDNLGKFRYYQRLSSFAFIILTNSLEHQSLCLFQGTGVELLIA